jgi:hypothetical protein
MRDLTRFVVLSAALLALPASAQEQGQAAGRDRAALSGPGPTHRTSTPPPGPRAEERPAAPSPAHIWIPGHWAWGGEQHIWVRGRYEPPRDGHVFLAPQWFSLNKMWTFYPGHWAPMFKPPEPGADEGADRAKAEAQAAPPAAMVAKSLPPPPRQEILGPPPSPQHQWIAGHWEVQGVNFIWAAGFWAAPRDGYEWEKARWQSSGDRQWRLVPGQWKKK